jgi:hypothetical protein
MLLAIAERMAAERYRAWAAEIKDRAHESDLLACAEREEEIASRVEALYPDAAAIQDDILTNNPDLGEINHRIFAGRPLHHQFAVQAQGERLGAATWRAFARDSSGASAQVFLGCAELEEASAQILEALLDAES